MIKNDVALRRISAGTLLMLAPLLQAIAVTIDPGTWGDEREAVSYAANPALAQAQSVLYHWSWMLMALAAFGLVHLTRRSVPRAGFLVGGVTVIGYISTSGLLLSDPVEWWLGQHHPPERAQQIMDEMMNLPGVVWGFQMPWMFLALAGLPLLTALVWRAGHVGWWAPALVALGNLGGLAVPYGPATMVLWWAPVFALGWIGIGILRSEDSTWASFTA